MNRLIVFLLIAFVFQTANVSATTINIGKSKFNVSAKINTIMLTDDKHVVSSYNFAFTYQGINYNTTIKKIVPIDLDSDGSQEFIVLLDPPDMMSPTIVILYFENGAIHKLLEGINLFAIPYAYSKKVDMHTLTLGADVVYQYKDDAPEESILKAKMLENVKDNKFGLSIFPNFNHIQTAPWTFYIDVRHLHYDDSNCEKLSFDTPTDIQSTSSNQLLIIYNNLLSLLDIRGLDKTIGSLDYGFFIAEYNDIISKVEEKDEYYAIHLRDNQEKRLEKGKVKFNYCNKGKWWRE